jgi:hypothetical protein
MIHGGSRGDRRYRPFAGIASFTAIVFVDGDGGLCPKGKIAV